ncbi:MAG: hypothetical protein ACREOC_18040 [Gemmatimonadales bacterium]
MSRSRKKTAIAGITNARSEKLDKRLANRKARRRAREAVRVTPAADVFPVLRAVSNVWTFSKDGKRFFAQERYPEGLRK